MFLSPTSCLNGNCDMDFTFGRHESQSYYQNCQYRSRNHGLFIASQVLRGNGAIYTRQNPNGDRYGYECPEVCHERVHVAHTRLSTGARLLPVLGTHSVEGHRNFHQRTSALRGLPSRIAERQVTLALRGGK